MACRFLLVLIALPLVAEAQSDGSYVISTFAGTPVPHTPIPSKSVSIFQPWGVAADRAGNVYISSQGLRSVFKLSGGTLTRVAGNGVAGYISTEGRAIDSSLSSPEGIAVDSAGNLYIADAEDILQVTPEGSITSLFPNYRHADKGW